MRHAKSRCGRWKGALSAGTKVAEAASLPSHCSGLRGPCGSQSESQQRARQSPPFPHRRQPRAVCVLHPVMLLFYLWRGIYGPRQFLGCHSLVGRVPGHLTWCLKISGQPQLHSAQHCNFSVSAGAPILKWANKSLLPLSEGSCMHHLKLKQC